MASNALAQNPASLSLDQATLRRLMPLGQLEPERLQELRKHLHIESIPAGTCLFTRGEKNTKVHYLLDGEVDFIINHARTTISALAPQARQPLDPHHPRHFTAITRTPVHILRIDRALLDVFVAHGQRNGYVVKDIADDTAPTTDTNWMETILKSKIFQKIPPINIQIMFTKLHEITARKGEIIFRQNQPGDDFYLIKSGSCAVLRLNSTDEGWRMVAELNSGQGFGEEALIADKPRNATIQMTSDGILMRLSREDFNALLKTPVVRTVRLDNAKSLINEGAIWFDVRPAGSPGLPPTFHGALAIPLENIRDNITKISPDQPLVVFSDDEQRSACAAYLLNAYGIEAIVLDGGLAALGSGE